jgi:hypothetical protein
VVARRSVPAGTDGHAVAGPGPDLAWEEGGVTTICKTVLSGTTDEQIQNQAEGLEPAQLRDLAVHLAADPDLTVSVITYDDGRLELEILHTGPPHHTDHTIDRRRFTRQPPQAASRTVSIAGPAGLQDTLTLVRAILKDATAP